MGHSNTKSNIHSHVNTNAASVYNSVGVGFTMFSTHFKAEHSGRAGQNQHDPFRDPALRCESTCWGRGLGRTHTVACLWLYDVPPQTRSVWTSSSQSPAQRR